MVAQYPGPDQVGPGHYASLWQSIAVYSNPTVEKCPILRVLGGHGRTLKQWAAGSSSGGCTMIEDGRLKLEDWLIITSSILDPRIPIVDL